MGNLMKLRCTLISLLVSALVYRSICNSHLVALAEWLNGLRNAEVNWTSSGLNNNMVYHQVELMHPAPFQEYNSQASDGTAYYAMSAVRAMLPDSCYIL